MDDTYRFATQGHAENLSHLYDAADIAKSPHAVTNYLSKYCCVTTRRNFKRKTTLCYLVHIAINVLILANTLN